MTKFMTLLCLVGLFGPIANAQSPKRLFNQALITQQADNRISYLNQSRGFPMPLSQFTEKGYCVVLGKYLGAVESLAEFVNSVSFDIDSQGTVSDTAKKLQEEANNAEAFCQTRQNSNIKENDRDNLKTSIENIEKLVAEIKRAAR